MRKAIIVDVDGTIADITHRLHFVKRPSKDRDYPAFFDAMGKDKPKKDVIEIIEKLSYDYGIIFVTGRPWSHWKETSDWIEKHALMSFCRHADFFMRPDGDFTPDAELKARIYEEKIEGKFDVVAVFDDRQSVVDMWRSKGLTCFQVEQWEEYNADKDT